MAAYASDLGSPLEQASGYFDAPWDWAAIKRNSGFIIQIGSEDDPLVPFEAQQRAAELMGASFYRCAFFGEGLRSWARPAAATGAWARWHLAHNLPHMARRRNHR